MINQPSSKASGFVAIAAVAIIIVVAIAATGGYLYLRSKTGDSNPLSALQKTTAGLTLNGKCDYKDADLCKFLNNWKAEQTYTMTVTGTDKDGAKSTSTFQLDGADKSHMTMSADDQKYETITIGTTTYTKDSSDNKWWKQTSAPADTTISASDYKFDVPSATASASEKTTFEKEGKEACGKLTCFKYHSMTAGSDSMEMLWFDDTQYLLRKVESTAADGSKSTIEYSYDKVSIVAPSPTKDVADDQMVMPDGSTMDAHLSQEEIDAMQHMADMAQ